MDTHDIATLVQFTLEEVFFPDTADIQVMQEKYEQAALYFPLELSIDAKGVFDAIAAKQETQVCIWRYVSIWEVGLNCGPRMLHDVQSNN